MFEFHPNAGIIASRLYEGIEIVFHKMEMVRRYTIPPDAKFDYMTDTICQGPSLYFWKI